MSGQSDSLAAQGAAVRGRRRKKLHTEQPAPRPAAQPRVRAARPAGVPAGWRTIAVKEFADQITSIRFLILTVVLALAAAAAVYSTAGALKNVASDASGSPSLFLLLFTRSVDTSGIPPFTTFITFLGPLLGIAFGFDGINGERSEGTLPRLLSQPIHRDDVVNGKFVAGLSTILVILIAVVGIVAAVGIIQLGIQPSIEDVVRLGIWVILAAAYIGFWLGFALLCSVVLRRAATSALTALSVWLVVTIFAGLLVGLLAGLLAPLPADATSGSPEVVANVSMQVNLARIAPNQLFSEATAVVLDPRLRTVTPDLVTPGQADLAIGSLLSIDQSVLVVWPQFVALIALTAGAFAVAYVAFMRQEVRA
jgi:ABC-2 type transport system permease protein